MTKEAHSPPPTRVEADPNRRAAVDGAITELMTNRTIDGMIRTLRRHFPELQPVDIEDGVYAGIEAYYARALEADVIDAGAYVYEVARRRLTILKGRRTVEFDDAVDHVDRSGDHDAQRRSRALAEVLRIVESWETGRERLVTKAVLEAAAADLQLSAVEIAGVIKAQGIQLSAAAVRTWKSRGLARIRRQLKELDMDIDDLEADEPEDARTEEESER